MLQAAVRRSHLGLCVVTVGLGRKTIVPNGQSQSWWWQCHVADHLPADQAMLYASLLRALHLGKFFFLFFFCQVQDSPSSKSYHTKSLRVSLGFSIAWCYRNRCLLVLSLWASVGCVTSKCWHCSTVSLFWSEEKESSNIKRFHHQKIPALPFSFFPNCEEQMASTESNFKPRPRVSGT